MSPSSSSFYLWNSLLGHVLSSHLKFGVYRGFRKVTNYNYSGCKLAKFSALPFTRSVSIYFSPIDLIHYDVQGLQLFSQKDGLDVMFLLLMIILAIVGFI